MKILAVEYPGYSLYEEMNKELKNSATKEPNTKTST